MNLTDELLKLQQLRQAGAISEEEFTAAKARLLQQQPAGDANPARQQAAYQQQPQAYPPQPYQPQPGYQQQPDYQQQPGYQQPYAGGYPQPGGPQPVIYTDEATKQWGLFLHLSQFLGFVVPFAGLVTPIIIWQTKKTELPGIDAHGKVVMNWILSMVIYAVVCLLLCFVLIGIPLLIALGLLGLIFPIVGSIKANSGEVWPYPLSIKFFT